MTLPSLAQAKKDVRHALARETQKLRAPKVIWAGLGEPAEEFAKRLAAVRKRWSGRILAAVPYGYAVPDGARAVEFSPKMFSLLHPDVPSRYRVASGGRGSGKSHAIATALILRMLGAKLRILCAREIQRSLRESVHHLLVAKIDELGLAALFDITDREIACKVTASEVIFTGLFQNANQLKSLEGIHICWCEESESISQRSFEILTPTIRAANSEIWLSANPTDPDAPIQEFIEGQRPDTRHVHVVYSDNPWFPSPLRSEMEYLRRVDDDAFRHIWLGECRQHSDAQVFKGKYAVEEFQASPFGCDGPYLGADFGFALSPTTLLRAWVCDNDLLIDHEAYALGCDLDRTAALFDTVPDARKYTIRADCARPESISYLQRHGYPKIVACEKWPGSIEDGISHIRSYARIVIHPRCQHTIEEFRLYSYKVDRLSGDVLPDLVDKSNDLVDALRYAILPLIRPAGEWHFVGA
jgi:phage terminase large subunit